MHTHFGMLTVGVHTIGRYKGIVSMVEHVKESLMERQSGPQHSSHHYILLRQGNLQRSEWRGYRLRLVFQRLRELIGHHLTDALNVVTEQKSVLLIVFVAQLRHVEVHDGIALTEINYLHINKCFKFGCKDTKIRQIRFIVCVIYAFLSSR